MSLTTVATRLCRSYPYRLFPLLHSITSLSSPAPLILNPRIFFSSAAFRRTVSVPYQNPLHFSPLRSFSTQNIKDPFELIQTRIHALDSFQYGLLDKLRRAADFRTEAEAVVAVDELGMFKADQNLVYSVIWALRKEWKAAVLAFKWGEKWECVDEKCCELIVWVLGNSRKFNIAWVLIQSMMNSRQTMLIMIDRYASANCPGKAIQTFHIMEKFRATPDEEAFYSLLNALCKHGNIEEAEEFMLVNKKPFPLGTEGFNIILNGWCNICVDVLEAKRVWREMSEYCVTPDATSYTHMISCFSKVGNLFDSLRLYDGMKKRAWVPGVEVYNSLIYVLTREGCFREALKILEKMKGSGLQPDSTSYNSMIRPLCEGKKLVEARNVLATMLEENICPTRETYHALLEDSSIEANLEVLNLMRIAGLAPTEETFLLIIVKFFKLKQPEIALKVWEEMKRYEVMPNLTHYTVLVEELSRCGLLIKAQEYYADMRFNGFPDDPKLQKILKEPIQDQNSKEEQWTRQVKRGQHVSQKRGSLARVKSRKQISTYTRKT